MRLNERFEIRMSTKMLADVNRMARYDESTSGCIRRILGEAIREFKRKKQRVVRKRRG
jgi:hypothetical protein